MCYLCKSESQIHKNGSCHTQTPWIQFFQKMYKYKWYIKFFIFVQTTNECVFLYFFHISTVLEYALCQCEYCEFFFAYAYGIHHIAKYTIMCSYKILILIIFHCSCFNTSWVGSHLHDFGKRRITLYCLICLAIILAHLYRGGKVLLVACTQIQTSWKNLICKIWR